MTRVEIQLVLNLPLFKEIRLLKFHHLFKKVLLREVCSLLESVKKIPVNELFLLLNKNHLFYTYDLILSSDNTEIAAKGGTANITAVLKTYRNGNLVSTDNVTPVLSGSATGFSISGTTVSASSRGATVGSERSINIVAKFAGTFDGQEVSENITIKQAANSQILREITNRYTSSNPFTGQNTVKANGGTVWVYTFAIYDYTSGDSSETNVSDECTFGNVTFGTWDSAKHTWTCPSAGTTVYSEHRGASIKVTWGSKKTTYYLYQEKNLESVKSISGGIYTYGDIVTGAISNKIIPASGGSATATAGNGSQTWNKSATITTYEYTSGATKDVTTEAASSGTANVVPNVASITATASSKGTTVSAQTTVKSQAVTWSANGKSASGTIYIYQAANKIESYNYGSWNIAISANPTTIAASGGTSTITSSCTRSKTPIYTSGSTGTATTESATPTLALTTNPGGFTLSGNKLTAANNPIGAKTATVTASYSGATSKSVSVSQAAGLDGIGYMQIQGDGTSHPIFRVGDNTRSVEPMSINETSETASDEDVSIFASIKKFLTKFV